MRAVQLDVLSLYRFYSSPLGRQTAQLIGEGIDRLLPETAGGFTVGLGYCLPYLDRLKQREKEKTSLPSDRLLAFMPERQGVCHWPSMHDNKSCLVDPMHMPLADSSVDRLIVVHAYEHTPRPGMLLREFWRILAPGGHLVVVVPNRLRAWSSAEQTPFGHGRPYSKGQLFSIMSDHMLPPNDWTTVLAMPPMRIKGLSKVMRLGDRLGRFFSKNVGGALIVHSQKQVYGTIPKGSSKAKTVPVFTQFS